MRVLFRSFACVVAALTASSSDPVGRSFASERELLRAVGDTEVVDAVSVRYPARVLRVELAEAGLQIQHGTAPRAFPATAGPLRAIFVEHGAGQGVLVVRANPRG
jgi:hypothetical protein